jgi:hypothetical protein
LPFIVETQEIDSLTNTLGTVDGSVNCLPGYRQFVGSKAAWFEIHDELPQYEGWPEEG